MAVWIYILLLCFVNVLVVTLSEDVEGEGQTDHEFTTNNTTLDYYDDGAADVDLFVRRIDPTGHVFYGCGLVKRCFSQYANREVNRNCIADRSCNMIVTFGKGLGENPNPDEAVIEIFAVAKGWAAVGISKDEMMGDDYVIECIREYGTVAVFNSWNFVRTRAGQGHERSNQRMNSSYSQIRQTIRVITTLYYDDRIYCKFYIKKRFKIIDPNPESGAEHEFDLDGLYCGKDIFVTTYVLYYFLLAFSNEIPDNRFQLHNSLGNLKSHVLQGGISEQGRQLISASEMLSPLPYQTWYFRAHAICMVVGWIFFMTLAIFPARYLKETLVHTKILGMEVWSFCHKLAALMAAVCVALSFMFMTLAKVGWVNMFRSYFHTYSGIITFCLFVLNFFLGFCVTEHAHKRIVLNCVHSVVGHISYNLAVLNILFSSRVAYGFLTCNFEVYIYAWFGIYYLLHAILSYHYCWVDFTLGRTRATKYSTVAQLRRELQLKSFIINYTGASKLSRKKKKQIDELVGELGKDIAHRPQDAPGSTFRIVTLLTLLVITIEFTIWILRKTMSYAKHCYGFSELKLLETEGFN